MKLNKFSSSSYLWSLLPAFALGWLFYHSTLEDAFITFRYAIHLAEGAAIGEWNLGKPVVEGFTTTSWMLLLTLGEKLGVSSQTFSKLIGWIAWVGLFITFHQFQFFLRRYFDDIDWTNTGRWLSWSLILCLPMGWYSVSGMESTAYVFLLLLFIGSALRWGGSQFYLDLLVAIALVLTRPEGAAAVVIVYVGMILIGRERKIDRRMVIYRLLAFASFLIALTLWRWLYFGFPLPNTYYAKAQGGWPHVVLGWEYLKSGLDRSGYGLLIPTLIATIIAFRKKAHGYRLGLIWATIVCVYLVMIIKTGGDNPYAFPYSRHLLHTLPLIVALIALALQMVKHHRRTWAIVLTVLVVIAVNRRVLTGNHPIGHDVAGLFEGDSKRDDSRFTHDPPGGFYVWLRDHFPTNTRMATTGAGEVSVVTQFHIIDMLGLNDTWIAHNGSFGFGAVDTKTDGNYVMRSRPDIIHLPLSAQMILKDQAWDRDPFWRGKMCLEIIDHEIFTPEYLFVTNAPYEQMGNALFVRRDFFENMKNANELTVVDVRETSLYPDSPTNDVE